MPGYLFLWDPETEEHLALHGVSTKFEEVVCNPDSVGESRTTGRALAFGYTSTPGQVPRMSVQLDLIRTRSCPSLPMRSKINSPRKAFSCDRPN